MEIQALRTIFAGEPDDPMPGCGIDPFGRQRGLGAEQVVSGDRDVLNGAVLEAASLPRLAEGAAPAGAFPCC